MSIKRVTSVFMGLVVLTSTTVYAQEASKSACVFDYIKYCSVHRLDSPGLKTCLEKNGLNLSPGCLKAMIDDGLVTREYINSKAKEKGMIARLTGNGIEFDRDVSAMAATKQEAPVEAPVVEEKKETVVTTVSKKVTELKEKAESSAKNLYKKTKEFIRHRQKNDGKTNIQFDYLAPKNAKKDYYKGEAEKDPIRYRDFPANQN